MCGSNREALWDFCAWFWSFTEEDDKDHRPSRPNDITVAGQPGLGFGCGAGYKPLSQSLDPLARLRFIQERHVHIIKFIFIVHIIKLMFILSSSFFS